MRVGDRLRRIFGVLITTLVSLEVAVAGSATYQYFRYTPTKLRNGASANSVQLSELQLYNGGTRINGATASNPGGNNPGNEGPERAVDGLRSTKWLDFNQNPLVLNYGSPITIDNYRWATANDATERDPIRWTLEGSANGTTWTLIDDRSNADQSVTTNRRAYLANIDLNQIPDTPVITFSVTAGGVTSDEAVGLQNGQSALLDWETTGASSVTLNGSPVSATSTLSVSPAVTTTYEIIGSNGFGPASALITVYVGSSVLPPEINEFSADPTRDGVLCDEDGDASDWIELFNPNPFAIDPGGYFLTDDVTKVAKWQIPAGSIIGPDGYLVIFASGKNRAAEPFHANFSLARGGEYLALLENDGTTIVEEFSPAYPAQTEDVSYGQVGGGYDFFVGPTPGAVNDTSPGALGPDVVFDTPPQSFTGSISVSLSTSSPSADIRYTTDGSLPGPSSSLYSSAISLSASALVRARTYESGFAPGKVKAEAYVKFTSTAINQTSDLPIVVLENFGGGSVPNGSELQSAYLTLYEPDEITGRTSLADLPTKANRAGIKRRGSSTLNDPKGNYRVEFWRDDSEEDKSVNLLGMSDHDEWILFAPYRFDRSLIRIPFIHDLSNDIGAYASKGKLVEVYLNTSGSVGTGDYQGVYVLQERISRGKDRVEIDRLDKNDTADEDVTGGYILSIDRRDSGDQGFRSALGHPFDPPNGSPQPWYTYVYPKEQNLLPEQASYIKGYIDDMEAALYGANYKDLSVGYRAWLDVEATIDFHILNVLTKDPDALRLSTYLTKPRNGKLAFGPIWDFDRTMGCDSDSRSSNPIGWNPPPDRAEFFDYDYWGRLFDDEDFLQQWIDRWQDLRTGQFANSALTGRLDGLAAQVTESQPRNAAKWPAVAPNGGPLTGLGGWAGEVDHLKNWVTQRADWMDTQFTNPPVLQASGTVAANATVVAQAQEGTIYYTIDGSDPRLPGGAVSGSATTTAGSIAIPQTRTIVARARLGSDWSGPVQSTFVVGVPASAANLVVSEIMYHPADVTASEQAAGIASESNFEFIEVQNISNQAIDLSGVVISDAFDFVFPVFPLAAGEAALVVRNIAAFEERFGSGLPIVGEWGDVNDPDGGSRLSNGGETITITAVGGAVIQSFDYDDDTALGWPSLADGSGQSLVLRDPSTSPDNGLPLSWRSSVAGQGTPGVVTEDVYQEWTLLHFSPAQLADDLISGPNADPDGDGIENAIELALVGDPLVASLEVLPGATLTNYSSGVPVPGDYLTITFQRRRDLGGLTALAQFSSDLLDWSDSGVALTVIDQGDGTEIVTYRDTQTATSLKRFLRVQVTLN